MDEPDGGAAGPGRPILSRLPLAALVLMAGGAFVYLVYVVIR